jgi:hypothetical protein
MGKVFKSAKKIVKKAAPVIGAAAGFALAGPLGVSAATAMGVGAGIGGLAGGHGVGKSLMYGMGAYGLGSLAGAGLGGAAAFAPSSSAIPGYASFMGPQTSGGFFSGIMGGLKGGMGKLMSAGRGIMSNFLGPRPQTSIPYGQAESFKDTFGWRGPNWPGTPPYVPPTTPDTPPTRSPWGWIGRNPGLALGIGTTALGYLGAKQKPETDPVAEAKRMMSGYQSPTDIKYGTKFSSAPGQKVKGLFWNPSTLQYQDQPVAVAAKGGIMSMSDFPRKTGQISGPGTETSDSVPALLSDGEFVMTAKAVRGMGNGSRREGAKRMYELMNQSERRAVA